MKKIKNIIIVIVILIIILTITVFLINKIQYTKNQISTTTTEVGNDAMMPTYELAEIKSISNFKTINNCVNTYLKYINENDNQAIYSLLINDYKEKNDVSINNAIKVVREINYNSEYMTKKVFEYNSNLSIKTYFVNGYILNKDEKGKKEYNIALNIDYSSETFEIAPLKGTYADYIDCSDFDNIVIKNEKIKDEIKEIEKSEFNNVEVVKGLRRKTNYGILF